MTSITAAVTSFSYRAAVKCPSFSWSSLYSSQRCVQLCRWNTKKSIWKAVVMAWFDVKCLFTSIPLKFTTKLTIKSLCHGDCKQFQDISQAQMKKLLKWVCHSTTFQLNGICYKQIHGRAMILFVALLLADVLTLWEPG